MVYSWEAMARTWCALRRPWLGHDALRRSWLGLYYSTRACCSSNPRTDTNISSSQSVCPQHPPKDQFIKVPGPGFAGSSTCTLMVITCCCSYLADLGCLHMSHGGGFIYILHRGVGP